MLEDLNCTMDKIDRDGEKKNKKHKDLIGAVPIMPCLNSSWIMDNELEDLWRRENPDSPEFTCYDRSFSKDPG